VDEVAPPALFVSFHGGATAPPPPRPAPEPREPKLKAERTVQTRFEAQVPPRARASDSPTPAPLAAGGGLALPAGVSAGELGARGAPVLATVATPPPPPAPEARPLNVPPNVGTGQRLTDINDPRFRPTLPGRLNRAGMMVWGLFRICVDTNGAVASVVIMKTAADEVDADWTRVIRTWRYRPYVIDGRATPFCHTIRLEVRAAM
jgi:hypothetical protein